MASAKMRIVFMGTPEFAVPTMLEILKNGHVLVAVYTRAPARGGRRGLEVRKTPVHEASDSFGIPVFTPTTLRDVASQDVFSSLEADVAVVAAYGLLLPIPILKAPALRCEPARLLAAALGRRRADPAGHHGRRCADRSRLHAHGCRSRHGSGRDAAISSDSPRGHDRGPHEPSCRSRGQAICERIAINGVRSIGVSGTIDSWRLLRA